MTDARIERADGFAFRPDRRRSPDRRRLSLRTFFQGSITPRRRASRRGHEFEGLVDWHEPHLLFLTIMILLLSVTDAFLTLTLLAHGAEESNPLMAWFLEEQPRLFAAIKMALTGGGLVILVALGRARVFRVIRISNIIHWCMVGYLVLIAYEAWLLSKVPPPVIPYV